MKKHFTLDAVPSGYSSSSEHSLNQQIFFERNDINLLYIMHIRVPWSIMGIWIMGLLSDDYQEFIFRRKKILLLGCSIRAEL